MDMMPFVQACCGPHVIPDDIDCELHELCASSQVG